MAAGPTTIGRREPVLASAPGDLTDAQLLHRFVRKREEAAFAELVRRHGPRVLAVCRRRLADAHLAEDAFQAVFLVLAKRAAHIRKPDSLASWLYGVAYRVAGKFRARAAQPPRATAPRPKRRADDPAADITWRELRAALDEELARLPDKYRATFLLCYEDGKTQDEAARALGWPRGTLKRRLERARQILREGLARRGLTLSAALIAMSLAKPTSAAVPAVLVTQTSGAALSLRPLPVPTLVATRVLKAVFVSKIVVLLALVVGFTLFPMGPNAAGPAECVQPNRSGPDQQAPREREQRPQRAQEPGPRDYPTGRLADPKEWGRIA
jgi:RNA polymerase sigma factor (sigma-70 family)